MEITSSTIKLAWSFLNLLKPKNLFFIVYNFLARPKLKLKLKTKTIIFTLPDLTEQHIHYPCLLISNKSKSKLVIKPDVFINNERYQVILQSDIKFAQLNKESKNHYICAFHAKRSRIPLENDQAERSDAPVKL